MVEMWKQTRDKEVLGKRNYFVFIWNGWDWAFFMGPFQRVDDANTAIAMWKQQYKITEDCIFRIEVANAMVLPSKTLKKAVGVEKLGIGVSFEETK